MLLITVATENEINPLKHFLANAEQVRSLVTGLGPISTAACLGSYLARYGSEVDGVLNIGVAGAYFDSGLALLDICLAKQEFLGDFGICMEDGIMDFDSAILKHNSPLLFDNDLVRQFENILQEHGITFKIANFVTVNCCTGTKKRGDFLKEKFMAGCENMEGGAVAMVCKTFNTPCVELRCVSNMVEDRDITNWRLNEAIDEVCRVTEILLVDHGRHTST